MQKKILHSLPLQLLVVIFFSFLLGNTLPIWTKELSYAISLTIMEILVTFLPLMIFSFICSSLLNLKRHSIRFLALLILCICLSNAASSWVAFFFGKSNSSWFPALGTAKDSLANELHPYWTVSLPKWTSNQQAVLAGLALGVFFGIKPIHPIINWIEQLKKISLIFLNKLFIPTVPLLVFGFVLKFQHDGVLEVLLKSYGSVYLLIILVEGIYLSLVSFLAAKMNFKTWFAYLKNLSLPVITGFSTMSSMAALPMSIRAAEKNTNNPDLARAVIPSTVNFHLVGDGIFVPLLAFAILQAYGKPIPDALHYLTFSAYFVLAKFSIAAVPAGGILVMIPVLGTHLGFSNEMLSSITALYILFDPVITACNVAGNGIFAILFSRTKVSG